jgi:hypothetical protein
MQTRRTDENTDVTKFRVVFAILWKRLKIPEERSALSKVKRSEAKQTIPSIVNSNKKKL